MHKPLRDTISAIREAGGTDITVSPGGRHTKVAFTVNGKREKLLVHSGGIVSRRFAPMIRSEIRRAVQRAGA